MKCTRCGINFDPRDSIMGDEGLCQDCWEAQCSDSWWAMVASFPRIRKNEIERPGEVG